MLGLGLNIFTLAIRRYFGGGGGQFAGSSLNLDFTSGNQSLDPRITFTRASTGTRINASGVMVSEAIDGPRFDYDPVTLQPKGLLIEEQRTNLLTHSEQFDASVWTKSNGSITANSVIAPNGTTTADAFIEDSSNSQHSTSQTQTLTANTTYTISVYVKPAGRTLFRLAAAFINNWSVSSPRADFDLSAGTVSGIVGVSAGIQAVGDGWYRCHLVATFGAVNAGGGINVIPLITAANTVYQGDGTSGIYIWGAQLEAGAFPTSYIPTTTAAATRAADVANQIGANFSNWFDSSKGTLFAEYSSIASGVRTIAAMNDGTANESIRLRTEGASPLFTVTDGGVDQANIDAGTVETNTVYRFAGAYAASDFAASINGGVAVTDTSGTLPAVNRMMIGNSSSGNHLNGHVRRLSYFPRRLSNEELRGITS